MDKLDMDKPYLITQAQRLQLLQAHNELKDVLTTVHDCQDLWMSDIRKLEKLQCDLHRIFMFVPRENDEGRSMHYADWVLAEEDDN